MKRVVLLTGSELRHSFLRKALGLANGLAIALTICEGAEASLTNRMAAKDAGEAAERVRHASARDRSERDFFGAFVDLVPDRSNPRFVPKGTVNEPAIVKEVIDAKPELVACYGSSLIKGSLLERFCGRFVNVHLGLSPYYRGGATNFWPLVNGEPEYIGATFMHIDQGVDTGEVIHQIRATIVPGDSAHQIGNRLIADMVPVYAELLRRFDELPRMTQLPAPPNPRLYKRADFVEEAVRQAARNLADGMIERYLAAQVERDRRAPIVVNPLLAEVQRT